MTERIKVEDDDVDVAGPYEYLCVQVDSTANKASHDYVFGELGESRVRVTWLAEVPLEERHKVMQDLVTLYNIRYGWEVT